MKEYPASLQNKKIIVVIPTYNEKENIAELLTAIFKQPLPGVLNVLIVDDASPDGTGNLVAQMAGVNKHIHLLRRSEKLGLGSAYRAGFTWALGRGADLIVQMDADFSHDPAVLLELINAADTADLVIGSRYVAGGSVDEKWGFGRKALSWWANRVWVRGVLGVPIYDVTAGFRVWRASALRAVVLERIKASGYFFQIETVYAAAASGQRIQEWPIHFRSRAKGVSKMDFRLQIEAAWGVIVLRLKNLFLKKS